MNTVVAGLMVVGMAQFASADDKKGPVTRPTPTGVVTLPKNPKIVPPDLIVADYKMGELTTEIWVLVKNIGGPTPYQQQTLLQVQVVEPKMNNWKDYGHTLTPPLKAGESKWLKVTMARDIYSECKLLLIADCKDQLPEGNENNNTMSVNRYVK